MVVRRSTTKLDGMYLVLNLIEYDDKTCRADVVYSDTGNPATASTTVMVQKQPSIELAVAAITRDFSTFAARALASLPTIGVMADPDNEGSDV